ncbi:arsenical pump-driving ATPase [Ectothiorhodospira lacustris]|uniref:arsenical pump-driving ATPase n=1 Tax=Ectothiorhodospira lacustris TaxID=2899127 RepID=UPI001EE792EA|nr:arsenical pump-driving ATPase [Ectothiorhodospira lacustris]MCG5500042.1 arsenical pump-driving ATPase [Ectothiorhodospira lacustris]
MNFLQDPTRHLFFTGKGGVGKTSLACAGALALAEQGRKVLLISTDPASNVDEVLETPLCDTPTPIRGVPGLMALNIDPEKAAADYRERVVGPYRGKLPETVVNSMEEQLSGACTMEIAAFDAFAALLGDPGSTRDFDHLVFDTAPTGHTLRLLSLPRAWTGYIESNTSGTSCLGPLEGLAGQKEIYARAMESLGDGRRTTLVLVSRPEAAALNEAARSSGELRELGVANQHLVVNGLFRAVAQDDPVARALEARGRQALERIPAMLRDLPRSERPLRGRPPMGLEGLRILLADTEPAPAPEPGESFPVPEGESFDALVDALAVGGHGAIMTMGKGGVGKTTLAARIAVALAERGHKVHLTTTDPAAHVQAAVGEMPEGMTIGRVDPVLETRRYREAVMASAGKDLDEEGRRLLEEDLRSPCTEEIAVFQAFAKTVDQAREQFVVLDTAPTGHTILLLDAAQAYHRELGRQSQGVPEAVEQLLPRLRDPAFTHVLICTLPEATPVHEAAALQADLRRAGIEPAGWIVNQALSPVTVSDPVLKARQAAEGRWIREILEQHHQRLLVVPWSEVHD